MVRTSHGRHWRACARRSRWCRRSRFCFIAPLAENIAYARPDATMAEIERAAGLAHAGGFVQRLPQRYATLVGERGVKLSGGERQRVAIARAILAGRTILVLAHRLSTVRQVDRILVFERGRIVEQGTHEALLARPDGRYRGLY